MKVLTVRQPWAWALAVGIKDIENRGWSTVYRGPLAIQASARLPPRKELDAARGFIGDRGVAVPPDPELALGAVVAVVELVQCVTASASAWFEGPIGWVVRDARQTVEPLPLKGQLGLFELGEDAERLIMRSLRV